MSSMSKTNRYLGSLLRQHIRILKHSRQACVSVFQNVLEIGVTLKVTHHWTLTPPYRTDYTRVRYS